MFITYFKSWRIGLRVRGEEDNLQLLEQWFWHQYVWWFSSHDQQEGEIHASSNQFWYLYQHFHDSKLMIS